ncbi:oxidoreductase [bacterium]|nr:oxidoreductase [bacterium]
MPSIESVLSILGVMVIASPIALLAFLGLCSLSNRPLTEEATVKFISSAVLTGLVASLLILAIMLLWGTHYVAIGLGNWVVIPEEHFHFQIKLVFDRLSVPFVILSFVLCGVIAAFGSVYLHRETGYSRFFLLYTIFLLGMIVTSLAGTIEMLFAGWELVGLSSALLVAFFHERINPVQNGLRVWIVYRAADAAFLIAAVSMHHLTGEGDFSGLIGTGAWPEGTATLSSHQALFVGSLLLIAAAGKSALIPFSGWLPRAMEGPTPSSAVFYGSLSVHLGAFLLLRVSPILERSDILEWTIVLVGGLTAIYATLCSRVQSDIKSALAFASLTQVGIIVAEIGLGWRYLPLAHIIGHACLRTLQLLRAPSLLRDYNAMENALGVRPVLRERPMHEKPAVLTDWLYRLSWNRGYLDAFLDDYIARPFVRLFQWFDRLERAWTSFLLSDKKPLPGDPPHLPAGPDIGKTSETGNVLKENR